MILASGYRFWRLRHFQAFPDEDETALTGRLLTQGERLYRSVFSHHMPVTYAGAQVVATVFPEGGIAHYRLLTWLFYIAIAGSLFASSMFHSRRGSLVAALVFLGSATLLLPCFKGQMLLADAISGGFFAIFFVEAFAPFLFGSGPKARQAVLGGIAVALALGSALVAIYPVALSLATCLLLAAISRPHRTALASTAGPFLLSLTGSALAVLLWMSRFGDLPGFFEQAYFFNSTIYARNFSEKATPLRMVWSTFPDWAAYVHSAFTRLVWTSPDAGFVILAAVALGLMILAISLRAISVRARLVGAAAVTLLVVFTRMRGADSRALSFYILVLCLAGLSTGVLWEAGAKSAVIAWAVALGLVAPAVTGDLSFRANTAALAGVWPPDLVPAAIYVHDRTSRPDRIAAFNMVPGFYFYARRRPAVDGTFYLPWQAWWEESFPRVPDTLEQLRRTRPRFVFLEPANIWGLFPWESYARPIDRFIKSEYRQIEVQRFSGHLWERMEPGPTDRTQGPAARGGTIEGVRAFRTEGLRMLDYAVLGPIPRNSSPCFRVEGLGPAGAEPASQGAVVLWIEGGAGPLTIPGAWAPVAELHSLSESPHADLPSMGWFAVLYPDELRPGSYTLKARFDSGSGRITASENEVPFCLAAR